MRSTFGPVSVPLRSATLLLGLTLASCSPGVRQDRTVTWSAGGQAVGFQHNEAGVFIANQEGGPLEKIFQPGPDVIVTSTPLWSPTDRRLLFTTARDPNGQPQPPAVELNPEGEVYRQRPVRYTCWLREEPKPGQTVQPGPLFEAACDHPGYVAANLAVRWHPKGDRILYLHQVGDRQHALFEFDLRTQSARRVFPQTAEALVFDWTPDGAHLVCVLGNTQGTGKTTGIWIGQPGPDDWWHVPHSEALADGSLPALLERVRATRPAWTADGTRFAFAAPIPGEAQAKPAGYSLWLGTVAKRRVERLAEGLEPFRDLHWAPDGERLGVVRGSDGGSLHLVRPHEELSAPVHRGPVHRFAGWNAAGDRLAYVVPAPLPRTGGERWAFVLTPETHARDAVWIAPGTGKEPGREVFSGLRVTFPHWSPKDDKLSLWLTFSPTHRSLLSRLLGWGLPAGDPAAVLDLQTGRVSWMAVHAYEKAQVGHYHLGKRAYAEARRWYEEAEAALPPRPAHAPGQAFEILLGRRDFTFFQYYCLTKLGRPDEARGKLEQFHRAFSPPQDGARAGDPGQPWPAPLDLVGALLFRDFYAAEVFLSLDATADAQQFFRQALAEAKTEEARLSSALVLAQLLLLEGRYADYADLATDTVRPLLQKVRKQSGAVPDVQNLSLPDSDSLLGLLGDLTLLPLYVPEFLAPLDDGTLQALLPRWEKVRSEARDEFSRLTADLFLHAAYHKLGREQEAREAAVRLDNNPARPAYLPKGLTGRLEEVRQLTVQLEALQQLLSGR
jgi:hypothetical protein